MSKNGKARKRALTKENLYLILEWYFSSAESESGYASNYGDMVAKMCQSSAESMQTDRNGGFDHEGTIQRLHSIGRLRRIRAALVRCSPLAQHTLGALFSDDAIAHRKGELDKFTAIIHHRLSPLIREIRQYTKTNEDPECFFLLKLAASQNTPPERIKRLAIREFQNAWEDRHV